MHGRSTREQRIAKPLANQPPPTVTVKRISSGALLGDAVELIIDHRGREYRLRVTQNGKLILTA